MGLILVLVITSHIYVCVCVCDIVVILKVVDLLIVRCLETSMFVTVRAEQTFNVLLIWNRYGDQMGKFLLNLSSTNYE